jgi:hypothetical protein
MACCYLPPPKNGSEPIHCPSAAGTSTTAGILAIVSKNLPLLCVLPANREEFRIEETAVRAPAFVSLEQLCVHLI